MRSRALVGLAFVVGLSAVIISTALSSGLPKPREAAPATRVGPHGQITVDVSDAPIPFGREVTLSEAEATIGDFPRPHHPLADDATIQGVWTSSVGDDTGESVDRVAIRYTSGVLMWIEPATGAYLEDAAAFYEQRASSITQGVSSGVYPEGTQARVDSIAGVPVLVTENPEGYGDLDLVMEAFRIELTAGYTAIDSATLSEIAGTLA